MDPDAKTTNAPAHPDVKHRQDDRSTGDAQAGDSSETGLFAGAILLVVGIVALLIVAIQNSQDVEFEFLWMTTSTPLLVVILVTIAVAILLDEIVGLVWRRRRRTRERERSELRRLRGE